MNKITKELLQEKLTDWTSSTKVQETLGLSSMDEALFKKELLVLETKGIIEREGAKKGLKFRFKVEGSVKTPSEVTIKENKKEDKHKQKSKTIDNTLALSELPSEIVNVPKNEHTHEVTNAEISTLFSFLLKGSEDRSISFKRTAKGITVKTYNNIYMLSEVVYTKENFLKLLKISGISLT